jgi:hypothetical protein
MAAGINHSSLAILPLAMKWQTAEKRPGILIQQQFGFTSDWMTLTI